MDSFSASETYSVYTYWREEPSTDSFEEEMRAELEEISKRQKAAKSNTKTKGLTATTPTTPTLPKTPTNGILPKTTPTTTAIKPGGEKVLTIAQGTENTMKRA
jgi:hypothetical protein